MSAESLYELDMGDQSIDVSATKRKFQTSVIVTQDASKSGILSILRVIPMEEAPTTQTSPAPQTATPSAPSGGY
tara:strand:- start:250 stop:471 length:222 start_codon:yes stop_codon:yes gene_type:complete